MNAYQVLLETLGDELRERLDGDLLPSLYASISVPTEVVRASFRAEGIAFIDGRTGQWPDAAALDDAVARVIAHARRRGVGLGVVSGLIGAVAVPPEFLARLVLALRLGQRLCVVYGVDPETSAGRLVLWRVVAAGFELEVPKEAAVGVRMRDLPDLIRSQVPAPGDAASWVGRRMVRQAGLSAVNRAARMVPGLGVGVAGYAAHRRVDAMGARMAAVLRRVAEVQPFEVQDEALAVEVHPGAR